MMIDVALFTSPSRRFRKEGNRARDRADWVRAAEAYRRHLDLYPYDFDIHVQLGHVLSEAGDHVAADWAYRAADALRADDADLLLCWGHSRKRAGDRDEARALYERSAAVDGNPAAVAEAANLAPVVLPEPEPPHPLESPPPPPYAGRIIRVDDRTIEAIVHAPDGAAGTWLDYRAGGRRVGRSLLNDAYRGDGGHLARGIVDVDGATVVTVLRMPGGEELEGSPVNVSPAARPSAAPGAGVAADILKRMTVPAGRPAAILTATITGGTPGPHVRECLAALRGAGIAVLLVIRDGAGGFVADSAMDQADGAIRCDAGGGVFAAWAEVLRLHPELYGAASLYLLDEGMVLPSRATVAMLVARVEADSGDVVMLPPEARARRSDDAGPIVVRPRLLASAALHRFFDDLRTRAPSDDAAAGAALAAHARETGHRVTILHPGPHRRAGPETRPPTIDMPPAYRSVAAAPAFPRSIAYYGPWNYAGEAGDAARATIAALRRLGVPLNLHPIAPPFRFDPMTAPAVDIIDDVRPPDIAIVQLEPQEWRLLSDAQQAALGRVRRRIACWSRAASLDAAMIEHLPHVDRVWAMDADAAGRIAGWAEAPVDVIAVADADADAAPPRLAGPAVRSGRSAVIAGPAATAIVAPPQGAAWPVQAGCGCVDACGPEALPPLPPGDDEVIAAARAMAMSLHVTMRAPPTRGGGSRVDMRLLAALPLGIACEGGALHALLLDADGDPGARASGIADALPRRRDDWIVIAPDGSLVTPLLSRILHDQARRHPDAEIFYGDDVAAETAHAIDQIRLKPEFDPVLLAAQDYIGAPVMVKADTFRALGGLRADMKTAAVADLLFRAHDGGIAIRRIPEVLLAHPQRRVRAKPADYRGMLAAQPALRDYQVTPGPTPGTHALARRFARGAIPPVTIIIPTCRTPLPGGQGSFVGRLLDRLALTDWPMDRLTVIVGDDVAAPAVWEDAAWPFALVRVATPRGPDERFNYAAKMNRLWRYARTEQIVFVNDDVLPLGANWLKALQTFALDPHVGGVGARLLYQDGRLQHAGMAPHGTGSIHPWIQRWRADGTYQDWALVHRQWSMVTGAVFATRRAVLHEVNGFDERFALEFNDTDLCLRMRAAGYRIVCTPHAELIHTEKASRGEMLPRGDEVALFTQRWGQWLAHDPAWHPGLRLDAVDVTPARQEDPWYR